VDWILAPQDSVVIVFYEHGIKIPGILWPAAQLSAFQVLLFSVSELVLEQGFELKDTAASIAEF
jgi:hypothetical protein